MLSKNIINNNNSVSCKRIGNSKLECTTCNFSPCLCIIYDNLATHRSCTSYKFIKRTRPISQSDHLKYAPTISSSAWLAGPQLGSMLQ